MRRPPSPLRRAVLAAAAVLAATAAGSCSLGAPPGFSGGDSWSFPLVGPLEGGVLVVPVKIHDRGPYLFVVDPDSPVSQLDAAIASELDLRAGVGPRFIDESDTGRVTRVAEVLRISIGTLTVRNREFFVHDVGTFNVAGRQIRGVLGRDVLADSLVFGFDRARGMGYIATQKGFQRPAGATEIGFRLEKTRLPSGVRPVSRRLTTARVGGKAFTLHVDLGEVTSQLRANKWGGAGLTEIPLERSLIDEVGTRRKVDRGGVAGAVEVGGVTARDVLFVPYGDKRWDEIVFDGTIGLGFFGDHAVWANWDTSKLYVVPPTGEDLTRARIDRWGSAVLSACAAPACTRAELLVPEPEDAGDEAADLIAAPPAAKPILFVERGDEVAELAFEALIEAVTAGGEPAGLPKILAIFPAGAVRLTQPLDDAYAGASFRVIDVSPFPRTCARDGACAYVVSESK